jgi:hypothetical protein
MSESTQQKKTIDLKQLFSQLAKEWDVDVKGKTFIQIYREIVIQMPRGAVKEALMISGHRNNGLLGEINEILRDALRELDEKEKAASAGTPAAVN